MVTEVISIVIFANVMGFLLMWMCGSNKNVESRTERELSILEEDSKGKN